MKSELAGHSLLTAGSFLVKNSAEASVEILSDELLRKRLNAQRILCKAGLNEVFNSQSKPLITQNWCWTCA